ncbi:hypothetical protein [Sphingomonas xinjiangensis]|uniref:Uncharacterized protein n=1 Tax=Sphingomonas xinjiangensis TaxID=643568 RepID=A0A840Y934_9SPHN|nr:hypothetical protein [Sphingomonas xinjiangensis]MBB5709354.1 hypothetical protein [Sphingomonas xinjiangensis]
MLPIFPAHIFNPDPVKADVAARVISGGEAVNGEQDVIQTDGGGRWEISYGEMGQDDPFRQQLWSAWVGELAGGARSVLVPLLSLDTAPRPVAGNGLAMPSDLYWNDDYFPTEVRFAAPYIVARVSAPATLRATTLQVTVDQGDDVQPGMKFSVGYCGFKIERVLSRNGSTATVRVSPPARESIAAGTPANFDWPVVVCRSVIGQDLAADIMLGMYGTTTVSFVEDTGYGG